MNLQISWKQIVLNKVKLSRNIFEKELISIEKYHNQRYENQLETQKSEKQVINCNKDHSDGNINRKMNEQMIKNIQTLRNKRFKQDSSSVFENKHLKRKKDLSKCKSFIEKVKGNSIVFSSSCESKGNLLKNQQKLINSNINKTPIIMQTNVSRSRIISLQKLCESCINKLQKMKSPPKDSQKDQIRKTTHTKTQESLLVSSISNHQSPASQPKLHRKLSKNVINIYLGQKSHKQMKNADHYIFSPAYLQKKLSQQRSFKFKNLKPNFFKQSPQSLQIKGQIKKFTPSQVQIKSNKKLQIIKIQKPHPNQYSNLLSFKYT